MKLWLAYALGTAIGTLAGIVLMLWAIWLDERERPA